ncbi:TPA: TonB-dependent siderophore receptor [Pseudomonas putida]|uniref:Metal-pseudopaline receptor CntO n=1 Tax=Pseudomonas putida (strain GB-1) TaxID=76869 RepID=B0KIQ9_PSEPG|nr:MULTISPECIES: TonB-dependent siderophore receptor [Pseudomonas]ABY99214.1 TonB-dependent siderophore receptor [Pseudomonas putida GB-1]APE99433.1 TonB-dependent receptor [Pseudomonas putida]MBP0706827.1 TonB-dependent siderophore receptor [Pseudomonas sp. T34]MCE1000172.1 TonB-dependent siderophore receptor [Pseudomonas sp. NMI1173_11]MCK2186264.1 TonB-dependent siderophore receptor [Pseudomonas sp. MB04B]
MLAVNECNRTLPINPTKASLARAVHRALFSVALATPLATAMIAQPAVAQTQAEMRFDIPAGALGTALTQFASAAAVTLSFEPSSVQALHSPGLHGRYSADAGLRQLLAGSRLQVLKQGSGSYSLLPMVGDDSTLQLDTTSVTGTAVESAYGPVSGYVASRSATGTKTDTPILEIPQAINVITADQVQAQGARNLTQALRYTPGLATGGFTDRNSIADEITSRGFAPTPLYLDGAYLPYAGSLGGAPQIDPYTLERIEVLKGPSSVLYGQNQPGGLINMVSKRPTREQRSQVKLGAGSYNRVNGAFDTSGPLDEQKVFTYRLVGVADKGNEMVAHAHSERLLLAPSLTWAPNEDTSLTLLAQVQRDDGLPDYQTLPMIGSLKRGPTGQHIDRDFFSGDSHYNDYKRNQYIFGYDFNHRFSDELAFRSTARYTDVRDRYKGFYLRSFVTEGDGVDYTRANRVKLDWRQHNISYTVDNNLEYKFNTGALQHTALAGVDYRHFTRKYDGYNAYNVLPVDLYGKNNFDTSSITPVLDTRWDNTVRQTGVYLQDQIKLDNWILTVGGRQDWAEIDNKDLLAHSIASQRDSKFTGRIGLTYVTEFGLAPYVSYSQSFLPTLGTAAPERGGKAFEPTEGEQYEVGLKYQPFEGTLFTASVFQVKQKNVLTGDTEYPQYESQNGEVRSRGVELELKSSIENVDVLAAATYIDSFYTKSTYGDQGNRNESQAPVSASLWVDYHFTQAMLNGLTFGAGARYTGRKPGNSANTFDVPAYAVYDATVSYDLGKLDPSLRGLQASVNVQNIFDREYVSDCNYAFGCYYGQERVASVEMTYDW